MSDIDVEHELNKAYEQGERAVLDHVAKLPSPVEKITNDGGWMCNWCGSTWGPIGTELHTWLCLWRRATKQVAGHGPVKSETKETGE